MAPDEAATQKMGSQQPLKSQGVFATLSSHQLALLQACLRASRTPVCPPTRTYVLASKLLVGRLLLRRAPGAMHGDLLFSKHPPCEITEDGKGEED